ncbi:hypothetical protein EDD17DRAFT_1514253 [Pisolithus thermaeus]|nr:hypothetical protein EDD17DRAFT_1514253 [Pisolithus thermaeus]
MSNSDSEDVLAERTPVKPCQAVTKATEKVYKRHPRNEPLTEEEMKVAWKHLQMAKSTAAIGTNIRMPTLYALCEELKIPVSQPGPGKFPTKATLLGLLGTQHDQGTHSELELSFMRDACRASNLAAYILSGQIPGVLDKLWCAFQQTFHSDIHGTCLHDILAFGRSSGTRAHLHRLAVVGRQANEDNKYIQLAMEYLGTCNLSCMVFQAAAQSPRDTNVIVWDKHSREKCTAARILALFTDTTATTSPTPSFAIIEQHVELSQKDQELDPYQHFRFPIAGALYYDKFYPPEVIGSNKLMTQFAKTVFIHEPLNAEVAHVLPIFKTIHLAVEQHLNRSMSDHSEDEDG